jgi:hypothetical protein
VQKKLILGYDRYQDGRPIAANGRSKDSVMVDETASKSYDLSDSKKEIPYSFSWTLNTLEALGVECSRNSVDVLAQSERSWIYPIAPIGYFEHWLFSNNQNTLLKHCSKTALNSIRTGKAFLLIDFAYEGNGPIEDVSQIFTRLHDVLITHDIPVRKTIFLFGNLISEELYKNWCFKNWPGDRINLLAVNLFESCVYRNFKFDSSSFIQPTEFFSHPIQNRKKLFLCFNRVAHNSRIAFGLLLTKMNLIDRGFYSFFQKFHDNWENALKQDFRADWIDRIFLDGKEFLNRIPIHLDISDSSVNPTFTKNSNKFYLDSKFSIVTETSFNRQEILLSEKIFKPIANFHPFIVIGLPNTLKYLQSLGYQTFHPWINEEYDQITDPTERLVAIASEVNRLSEFSELQWQHFSKNLNKRLLHNRRKFEKSGNSLLLLFDRLEDICYPERGLRAFLRNLRRRIFRLI